jgi:hypothetical protein
VSVGRLVVIDMAKKRTTGSRGGRAEIARIARELADLRIRKEELERERRSVFLSISDAMFERWDVEDLRERRWNTEPPPLAVERVRP